MNISIWYELRKNGSYLRYTTLSYTMFEVQHEKEHLMAAVTSS